MSDSRSRPLAVVVAVQLVTVAVVLLAVMGAGKPSNGPDSERLADELSRLSRCLEAVESALAGRDEPGRAEDAVAAAQGALARRRAIPVEEVRPLFDEMRSAIRKVDSMATAVAVRNAEYDRHLKELAGIDGPRTGAIKEAVALSENRGHAALRQQYLPSE